MEIGGGKGLGFIGSGPSTFSVLLHICKVCFRFHRFLFEHFIEIIIDLYSGILKKPNTVILCTLFPVSPNGTILQNCSIISRPGY